MFAKYKSVRFFSPVFDGVPQYRALLKKGAADQKRLGTTDLNIEALQLLDDSNMVRRLR
jgi:hypothetical protein